MQAYADHTKVWYSLASIGGTYESAMGVVVPNVRPRIVAVIDDDPSVRNAARDLLRSLEARVEVFASAEDFLASAVVDSVACIVVDIRMPGMSGFDLQHELIERGHSVPTVFISADDHLERAGRAGAIFLFKPFSANALVHALESAFGGQLESYP